MAEARKNLPRLGRAPFDDHKINWICSDITLLSMDRMTIALNLTWQEMHEVQAIARALLRRKSGKIAQVDGECYKTGEQLQLWQEERPTTLTQMLSKHGIYTMFMQRVSHFQIPYLRDSNGSVLLMGRAPQVDEEALTSTIQDDRHMEDKKNNLIYPHPKIGKPTWDQMRRMAERIIQLEMDRMRRNAALHSLATEDDFPWKCSAHEPGPSSPQPSHRKKREKKRKVEDTLPHSSELSLPQNRKVLLLNAESDHPHSDARATPRMFEMLPKTWPGDYVVNKGFPFHKISDQKLWGEVAKLMKQPEDELQKTYDEGWLRYVYLAPDAKAALKVIPDDLSQVEGASVWRVKTGAELGALVQMHCSLDDEADEANALDVLELTYCKGQPADNVVFEEF